MTKERRPSDTRGRRVPPNVRDLTLAAAQGANPEHIAPGGAPKGGEGHTEGRTTPPPPPHHSHAAERGEGPSTGETLPAAPPPFSGSGRAGREREQARAAGLAPKWTHAFMHRCAMLAPSHHDSQVAPSQPSIRHGSIMERRWRRTLHDLPTPTPLPRLLSPPTPPPT